MKKLYYKFTKKYWSMLSYEHARKHNFVVQYGIFKNLKMNEKISWGKIGIDTPRFVIESDATIVLPLILTCLLESN